MKLIGRLTALLAAGALCSCGAGAENISAAGPEKTDFVRPGQWMAQANSEELGLIWDNSPGTVYRFELPPEQRNDQEPEMVFLLEDESLSGIQIRSGDLRNPDAYRQSGRIHVMELVAVTDHGRENYGFQLRDEYRMDTRDEEWQLGYQCIRFPRTWTGVQRLEVWIRDIYPGETEENVICIADVRLSAGDPEASGGVLGNQLPVHGQGKGPAVRGAAQPEFHLLRFHG